MKRALLRLAVRGAWIAAGWVVGSVLLPPSAGAEVGVESAAPTPLLSFLLDETTAADDARSYRVYVPSSLDPSLPAPVVVDLHGSGSGPEQELDLDGMDRAADDHGFLVVLPVASEVPFPGGGFTWNVPHDPRYDDDVRFVADVIDDVSRRFLVDPGRVYLSGFSGGARLASAVACAHGHRFAALAAVGGLRRPDECHGAVPVIAFHGTDDPLNPYSGGGPAYWGHGVDEAVEAWAESNGCSVGPTTAHGSGGLERLAWTGCEGGGEVLLHRLRHTGHVWPGSNLSLPAQRFGPPNGSVDATRAIVGFFERHRRRPARANRPRRHRSTKPTSRFSTE